MAIKDRKISAETQSNESELLESINEHYGSTYLPEGEMFIRAERVFIYSGGVSKLKALWKGLHLANTDLSLTIEGAQMFGKSATKNTITLTREQAEAYYRGQDLDGFTGEGYVLLKTTERPIGCGLLEGGRIRNIIHMSRMTSL
jgi:NOL1/NOP2/fmu family ribosome biogenesis protein